MTGMAQREGRLSEVSLAEGAFPLTFRFAACRTLACRRIPFRFMEGMPARAAVPDQRFGTGIW